MGKMSYTDYLSEISNIRKVACDYSIYELIQYYLEYILDIFVSRSSYENIPAGFDSQAFEVIQYVQGQCPVVRKDDKVYCLPNGYEFGVGPYSAVPFHERFLNIGVTSAYLGHFEGEDGKDIVMCHNTQSSRSFMPLFMKSAVNLAHIDKSIQVFAVNSRLHGIFSASDQKDVRKVETFYNNLIEGKYGTIENGNPIFPDVNYTELPTRSQNELNSLIIARNNELRYVMRMAGISMDKDKNQAVLSNESEDDADFLAHNMDIVIEARYKSVDEINRVLGTNMIYHPADKKKALENIAERKSIVEEMNKNVDTRTDSEDDVQLLHESSESKNIPSD